MMNFCCFHSDIALTLRLLVFEQILLEFFHGAKKGIEKLKDPICHYIISEL
jgi:hypothetical protein